MLLIVLALTWFLIDPRICRYSTTRLLERMINKRIPGRVSRLGIATTRLAATLFLRLNNITSVICQFSRRSRRLTVKDIVHLGKLLPQHCLGDLKQLLIGAGEVNRSTVHHDGSRRHLADGLVHRKKLAPRTCWCWTDPPPMVEEAC